ncbi:hypothetical protein B0I00_1139 [Novosphingobium kunmingense]|uniref:DUF1489 family protein n=1 Tax=Novosphingobium kunmingense TaxID=1211806 RepID=A0A2N0I420_9SPHN|nr:DUF1489 domain-containing protein [Novosphingobium kunmingense]PKB25931.1 hypothetical protein B0I00_1139 [Novosphingobium kunmingense]
MPLHLTKVAYGAQSIEEMRSWFAERGPEARLTTRYLPKRHAEIVTPDGEENGSLFWIFKHQLVLRSPILRFEEAEGGKTHIVIEPRLIDLMPSPKRAHQGWRYLEGDNAPRDLGDGESAGDAMPGKLASDLARLGLV